MYSSELLSFFISKWHQGEPNNYATENCAEGLYYKDGFWNDISCNKKISVICYKSVETTSRFIFKIQ